MAKRMQDIEDQNVVRDSRSTKHGPLSPVLCLFLRVHSSTGDLDKFRRHGLPKLEAIGGYQPDLASHPQ
jgi:hypothetical protein